MIFAFSTCTQHLQSEESLKVNKILSTISKVSSSEGVPPISSSSVPKSPKGKKVKKDDEAKLQEETERLQKEADSMKKISDRQKQILEILKEQESASNLYLSTPNGIHLSFKHGLIVDDFDSLDSSPTEKTFVLKQQQFTNEQEEVTLENHDVVKELYRCITDDGLVLKVFFIIRIIRLFLFSSY